jgi:acetyl esterase
VSPPPSLWPSGPGPIEEELGPLDPELAAAVEGLPAGAVGMGDIHAMREFIAGSLAFRPPPDDEHLERTDLEVPAAGSAPAVQVRRYVPRRAPSPAPGLVWCHGGGFVFGDLEVSDGRCADLAIDLGAVVVSVDYRLAPEHPFPAAVEDAYAATVWVVEHADELGVDPARLVVGGSSAGATIAAAVALMARDRGGPSLALQVLWQPAVDDECETPSSRRVTDPRVLHRQVQLEMWDHYLGPAGTRGEISPYAAPARAHDLSGLPPAVVAVAEHDPLCDEGRAYAQRLIDAGVPSRLLEVSGAFHGFEELVPDAAISRRSHRELVDEVAAALTA